MGKKQKKVTPQKEYTSLHKADSSEQGGASLKDLLNSDVLAKLKAQSDELTKQEQSKKAKEAEEKAEQQRLEKKRLESDFAYLLENSDPNWNKYK